MSPKPYLALLHSLLSLPLAIFYFTFVWVFILFGGFTYYLFALGMFVLVGVAIFLRVMTTFEVFLARTMLSMGDRLGYSPQISEGPSLHESLVECDLFSRLYQSSKNSVMRYKSFRGGMITTDEHDNIQDETEDFEDDEEYTSQHHVPSQSNTTTDTTHEIIDEDDEEVPFAINASSVPVSRTKMSMKSGSVHQYYQQQSYGTTNLLANNEYYQQYGAMMSRSLDHDNYHDIIAQSRPTNTNQVVIIKRAPSREKKPEKITQNPIPQQTPKKKKRSASRRGSLGAASSPSRQQLHDSMSDAESVAGSVIGRRHRSVMEQLSAVSDGLRAYVFHSCTGFGLLYVVVKLPVSVVTFSATILLVVLCLGGYVPAIIHLACQSSKYRTCASILGSKEWYMWFVTTVEGNVVSALVSLLFFVPCVYLLYSVTKLARDAVAIVGDDKDSKFS
jgi:hypothetical protein